MTDEVWPFENAYQEKEIGKKLTRYNMIIRIQMTIFTCVCVCVCVLARSRVTEKIT